MKRFYVPWLHFLVRPSRVDFASLAARSKDETAYLLGTSANAEHLRRALEQVSR